MATAEDNTTAEETGITWDKIRELSQGIAAARGEWAGIPQPIEGLPLVLEPRYPYQGLAEVFKPQPPTEDEQFAEEIAGLDFRVRNWFHCPTRGQICYVYENILGRVKMTLRPTHGAARFVMLMDTLQASDAWAPDAEPKAMETLASHVTPRQLHQYVTTGTFLESSKRSGVFYLFRRLRPTIALGRSGFKPEDSLRIMCALCLHPIGYYQGCFAGALCPTDDVIAHLLLMRGDEHGFWKKANQHPVWVPEAGL